MFKSVFAKYVTAFVSIILLSFLFIIAIISLIIGNYSTQAKADIMYTAANSSAVYLQSEISDTESGELSDTVMSKREDIEEMLRAICSSSDDLTVLLTDTDGKIMLATGNDASQVRIGDGISLELIDEANKSDEILSGRQISEVFEKPHFVYSVPIYAENEQMCGTVLVCASTVMLSELLEVIVKTIIIASLWVLVASLIAVYFISEKVMTPLKEISRAAKSFASGKFDVRVPVRGRDEVAELAVAFNNMAESLNNYDLMRNTFMSNVSHDLRTPMTSIAGFIDGILDGVIPPDKHKYYLQIVSGEVKRLSRLVASLLDLSRIQAGERKFSMSSFDICEMGRQILLSFEQKIDEKKLEIEFLCDEENLNVIADRDAIYQIFYNLCDNAVKFASESGTLRIEIRRIRNKKLLISVYNDGQGISSADLPYVFERFYKSDKSRGLNKSGVGLGLFIAKTIIDAHGEKIWAESEHGKNCCFKFTLTCE